MTTGKPLPNDDNATAELLLTELTVEIVREKEAEGYTLAEAVSQIPIGMLKPDEALTPEELVFKERRIQKEARFLEQRLTQFRAVFGEEHIWSGPVVIEGTVMPTFIGIYVFTPPEASM